MGVEVTGAGVAGDDSVVVGAGVAVGDVAEEALGAVGGDAESVGAGEAEVGVVDVAFGAVLDGAFGELAGLVDEDVVGAALFAEAVGAVDAVGHSAVVDAAVVEQRVVVGAVGADVGRAAEEAVGDGAVERAGVGGGVEGVVGCTLSAYVGGVGGAGGVGYVADCALDDSAEGAGSVDGKIIGIANFAVVVLGAGLAVGEVAGEAL